jgi:hypothetical protein
MMFSVNEIDVLGEGPPAGPKPQLVGGQEKLPRLTYRYSTLAVQFGRKAHSTPAPAVQPVWVALAYGKVPNDP